MLFSAEAMALKSKTVLTSSTRSPDRTIGHGLGQRRRLRVVWLRRFGLRLRRRLRLHCELRSIDSRLHRTFASVEVLSALRNISICWSLMTQLIKYLLQSQPITMNHGTPLMKAILVPSGLHEPYVSLALLLVRRAPSPIGAPPIH